MHAPALSYLSTRLMMMAHLNATVQEISCLMELVRFMRPKFHDVSGKHIRIKTKKKTCTEQKEKKKAKDIQKSNQPI